MRLKFSEGEKDIFGKLLETCSDELGNNGCNDYTVPVTDENRESLIKMINEMTEGDESLREKLLEDVEDGEVYFQDWMVLDFLKDKILQS